MIIKINNVKKEVSFWDFFKFYVVSAIVLNAMILFGAFLIGMFLTIGGV